MNGIKCIFILSYLIFCGFSYVIGFNNIFKQSSIIYGISVVAEKEVRNNGSINLCYTQLSEFYKAVDSMRVWSYKLIDISGRPTSGFLGGNNDWTGQSTTCNDLTNKSPLEVYHAKVVQLVTEYDYPPYELGFIIVSLRHDSIYQLKTNTNDQNLITLGLCVPMSCTINDIQPLLKIFFNKKFLTFQKLYDVSFEIENMKAVDPTSAWLTRNPRNIITLSLIIGIIVFVLCATCYHLNVFEKSSNNNVYVEELNTVGEISIFEKISLCFSLSNTSKLLTKSDVPDNIAAINGMMFFSMLGISIHNFFIYGALYTRSLAMDFKKYEGIIWHIVVNSSFFIDSFLFLSGCLVSYNFYIFKYKTLLHSKIKSRIYEICKMIIEKFIRLVPVYIMLILWSIYLFSYLDARWSTLLPEKVHESCTSNWWKNLLFINNLELIHNSNSCMSWTWFIAADFQYYIVNLLLMLISIWSIKLSICFIIFITFYCIFSTAFTAYGSGYMHRLDQQIAQVEPIYYLPWHRIGPYAIGMLTGILLYRLKSNLPLKKKYIWLAWAVAPLINLYLIFGLYGIKPSVVFSSIYISVGRTLWAIGLAWILIACSTGHAGFINSVLSNASFKIFHKLSYSTYILMVLNIIFICVTYETKIYLSTISYISHIFSFTLFPYLLNIIFSMFYEIPIELLCIIFYK